MPTAPDRSCWCSHRSWLPLRAQAQKPLDIYFIDVEGGQATLFVTPSGESMLIDTGYPGLGDRDVNRVLGTIKQAGLTKLDYLLVTHYHNDHVGNAAAIAHEDPGRHVRRSRRDRRDRRRTRRRSTTPTSRDARAGRHMLAEAGRQGPDPRSRRHDRHRRRRAPHAAARRPGAANPLLRRLHAEGSGSVRERAIGRQP